MKQVSRQKMLVHQNLGSGDMCCSPGRKSVSGCGWVSWLKPRRFKCCCVNKIKPGRPNREDEAAKAHVRFASSPALWASGLLGLAKNTDNLNFSHFWKQSGLLATVGT